MEQSTAFSELEAFARQCINSQNHPEDDHIFTMYYCSSCRSPAFRMTLEHHTGSEEWNFRGIIWGECTVCGYLMRLFTFTGASRTRLREERPECDCGNRIFMAGQCERFEGEQGIAGFFDEGVIAGKCMSCNRNKVFVYTD
jgi:hypothetical protein